MPVQQRVQQNVYKKATLYAFIFESIFVKMAVIVMFSLLLLQPIAPAFAFEEEASNEEVEVIVESEPVAIIEEDYIAYEETSESEVVVVDVVQGSEDVYVTELVDGKQGSVEIQPEEQEVLVETQADQVAQSETVVSEEVDVPDADTNVSSEEVFNTEVLDTSSSTDEVPVTPSEESEEILQDEDVQEMAVGTTSTTTVVQELVSVHNESAFSFDTTQCAVVGDGAYYCSERDAHVDSFEDGVFTAPDSDGDLEIYIRVNGEEQQITHNTHDDSAPYYDAVSKRIVWHSLIDDRYQVVSYTLDDAQMTRLTSTAYNNMEPVAYGEITLWQAWIDNNWEVMLFDGESQRQITNNTLNDVSPHMREGYIVWQTQFADGWQVAVYNQETKEVEYIPSEGGLKVENPRFVLVYDSTDANGDIKTVGYDFDSKSSFNLGVLPQELPEELPEPDQTGETRALIQNKQTSREGEQELIDIATSTPQTGSSTPGTHTLDLSSGSTTVSVSTTTAVIEDVVIPSYVSTTTASQDIFTTSDIVIPPFVASTSEQVS